MLDNQIIVSDVARALAEDVGEGDITAQLIDESAIGEAHIVSREPMVVCGIPWVQQVFHQVDPMLQFDWHVSEKEVLAHPKTLLTIKGIVRHILTAERTALNFLQTLSGIATETRRYVACLEGTKAKLLDTRKTIPGLRAASKYAVICGGGENHRFGLYDAILIKENHIKACGSIQKAVQTARELGRGRWIEVEVENLAEFKMALEAAPDRILLDNFNVEALEEAVLLNTSHRILLEASGGIDLENLARVAKTGVDYISVGAITKSVRAIDLSLLLDSAV